MQIFFIWCSISAIIFLTSGTCIFYNGILTNRTISAFLLLLLLLLLFYLFHPHIVQLCMFITHALSIKHPTGFEFLACVWPFHVPFMRCVAEGVKSWLWLACFYVSMAVLLEIYSLFIYKTCIVQILQYVLICQHEIN